MKIKNIRIEKENDIDHLIIIDDKDENFKIVFSYYFYEKHDGYNWRKIGNKFYVFQIKIELKKKYPELFV